MFIDTHCHLSIEDYDDIDKVIKENRAAGISKIIISGCTKETIKESVDLYKQALRVTPNDAEIYMLLGNAHYLDNDIEKAIASYKSSIALAPDNDEYRLIYSQVVEDYVNCGGSK